MSGSDILPRRHRPCAGDPGYEKRGASLIEMAGTRPAMTSREGRRGRRSRIGIVDPRLRGDDKVGTWQRSRLPHRPRTPDTCYLVAGTGLNPVPGRENPSQGGRYRPSTMPSQSYGRGGDGACPGRKPKGHRGRPCAASQLPDHQHRWWSSHSKGVAAMDQPYSLWADWLSKFQSSSEAIQALWLVAVPATLLGLAWLALWTVRDLVGLARRERHWRGHLVRRLPGRPGPLDGLLAWAYPPGGGLGAPAAGADRTRTRSQAPSACGKTDRLRLMQPPGSVSGHVFSETWSVGSRRFRSRATGTFTLRVSAGS
jgi:hypothetical protein